MAIVPIVEIITAPPLLTRSQTATFVVTVKDAESGDVLPAANLFVKVDGEATYAAYYTARSVTVSELEHGAHVSLFIAELNGTYATAPARYDWQVDLEAPSVVNTIPSNNTDAIGTQAPIVIEFSEPMDVATVATNIAFSPHITGTWHNTSQIIFTYTPSVDMENLQMYTITVGGGVQDRAGNAMLAPYVFRFTTIQRLNEAPNAPHFANVINASTTSEPRPRIVFNVPNDADNDALHFTVEVATDSNFAANKQLFNTITHADSFVYYNHLNQKITPFPNDGVPPGLGKIIFRAPNPLSNGEYWYRISANDRR